MSRSREVPRVTVQRQVKVILSPVEVEHALRCWLSNHLTENSTIPREKSFAEVYVSFDLTTNEHHEAIFDGVTLTYEPRTEDTPPAAPARTEE